MGAFRAGNAVARWDGLLESWARLSRIARIVAWLAAALLAGAIGILVLSIAASPAIPSAPLKREQAALARLQSLPVQAQSAISTAVAADTPVFAATRTPAGYRSAGGGVTAQFGAGGVALASHAGSMSFSSLAVGRGDRLAPLAPGSVSVHANRVIYDRGAVAEWYAAGPLGIEQGFTVARRPGAAGRRLTLALGARGALRPEQFGNGVRFVAPSGAVALRYGGLEATDARGRVLPVALTIRGSRLLISVTDAHAMYPIRIDPFVQQGGPVTPNDEAGPYGYYGHAVALSADGNTALISADEDGNDSPAHTNNVNESPGAAWVFTRTNNVWAQQGPKLVGNPGGSGAQEFGSSVSLSADGNTALIGAWGGDLATFPPSKTGLGSAYIFTRAGGVWTRQTMIRPVNPTDSYGLGINGGFGGEVALSADGTTALVAGDDGSGDGQFWVFKRSGASWSSFDQQGAGPYQPSGEGAHGVSAVALSSDGSTALIGSFGVPVGGAFGSAWVFTRSGSSWSQQGPPLAPTNGSGSEFFGDSVALSGDGNTALVGAPLDGGSAGSGGVVPGPGAAFVFTRSGSTWAQQTNLTATGSVDLGAFVGLTSDGNTAEAAGGIGSAAAGGAYEWTRSGAVWTSRGASPLPGATNVSGAALSTDGRTIMIGIESSGDGIGTALAFRSNGLVVTSTGDLPNADPTGTACDDGTGKCTLRGAIQAANARGDAQEITFDIPGGGVPTVSPASPLPAVTAQVTVDGTSQPGTPAGQPGVRLDGAGAGSGASGLRVQGGASTVKGLIVTGFSGAGISLEGAGGDTVTGDWLGTYAGGSGYADAPDGIGIKVAAANATIGGSGSAARNVVADGGNPTAATASLDAINRDSPPPAAATEAALLNFGAGVRIASGGNGAVVRGNWLGLEPDGSRAGPNIAGLGHTGLVAGIQVAPAGGSVAGVTVTGNVVTDAVIGIQVASVSGTASGVVVGSNVVGPDAAGAVSDLIGNAVGIEAQGAVPGLTIGGGAGANTIQGNGLGVALGDTDGAAVSGNTIGTNGTLKQLSDTLTSSSPNPGLHNIIGVVLGGTAHTVLSDNRILGDVMGVLSTSTVTSRANQITGNVIGYTPATAPKDIEGLKVGDLGSILGILDEDAPGDTISGNTVKLTAIGVLVGGGHGVTVQNNELTTNGFGLFSVQVAASAIHGNTLVRNLAGLLFVHGELTPTELKAIKADQAPVGPSDRTAAVTSPGSEAGLGLMAPEGGVGLTSQGVTLASTTGQTSAAADRRAVTRAVTPGFAANITGNRIGTDGAGGKLGNVLGTWLIGDVTGTFATNTVANNLDGGVWVGPSIEGHFPTVGISHNSIYSNGAGAKADDAGQGLGIDLLGDAPGGGVNFDVTANHAGGSVPGPNGLQNYPLLTGSPNGSRETIVGILDSAANTGYRVELFASPVCNPSGNGEGKQFLESVPVSTDGGGWNVFSATPELPAGTGVITATATGPDGTSEFSRCLPVPPPCGAAGAGDLGGSRATTAGTALERRRRAIAAAPGKRCSVSAQRRQKELQLKQQITVLQTLRNEYNADKATQWYAAQVLGVATAFPPTAVLTGSFAGLFGTSALVSEESAAQLETQIAVLQGELDSMIAADKKKPAADPVSSARASRAAGRLGVIAKPVPIKLVLPRERARGIRTLEAVLSAQARLRSLQRAANTTQQRALAATKARNAKAAKRQWLALASYDTQMASAWRSISKLQTTFAKLVASAAGSRKLTSAAAAKALRKYAGSLPAFAITDARRLGDLTGLRALARGVRALNPNLLAGPAGKLLIVQNQVIQVRVTPVVQALSTTAAIARSLAASSR